MTTNEPQPDFGTRAEFQTALNEFGKEVVTRHNAVAVAGYEHPITLPESPNFGMAVLAGNLMLNRLVIFEGDWDRKGNREIQVGRFDPLRATFMANDQVTAQDELDPFQTKAKQARERAKLQGGMLDFDDPALLAMRQRHRDILLEDGMIYAIAERDNKRRNNGPDWDILVDDATILNVALVPTISRGNRGGILYDKGHKTDPSDVFPTAAIAVDNSLGIRPDGQLYRRQMEMLIEIAALESGNYWPIQGRVAPKEYARLFPLVEELVALNSEQPLFDPRWIAFRPERRLTK